jgi:hypothetical protein
MQTFADPKRLFGTKKTPPQALPTLLVGLDQCFYNVAWAMRESELSA